MPSFTCSAGAGAMSDLVLLVEGGVGEKRPKGRDQRVVFNNPVLFVVRPRLS